MKQIIRDILKLLDSKKSNKYSAVISIAETESFFLGSNEDYDFENSINSSLNSESTNNLGISLQEIRNSQSLKLISEKLNNTNLNIKILIDSPPLKSFLLEYDSSSEIIEQDELLKSLLSSSISNYYMHKNTIDTENKNTVVDKILESEESLSDLVESASDFIFILNDAGYYVKVNKNGAAALNYSSNEMVGKFLTNFGAWLTCTGRDRALLAVTISLTETLSMESLSSVWSLCGTQLKIAYCAPPGIILTSYESSFV